MSLIVSYPSLGVCLILLCFLPPAHAIMATFISLNWTSYGLALSQVEVEVGFLVVHCTGWNLRSVVALVNVMASLILVPVVIFFFKPNLS